MIDRKSKLLKKAKSGMVMTEEQYASCRELSVHGDPTVSIIKDSRSSRSYDTSSNVIIVFSYLFFIVSLRITGNS